MSNDQVDDIEGAEDWIGVLEAFVRKVAALPVAGTGEGIIRIPVLDTDLLIREAVELLGDGDRYCRPTCGFLIDGECLSGDTCGCPCGHDADAVDAAAEQPTEGWARLKDDQTGEGGVRTVYAHWWREDGTAACDERGDTIYRGPRTRTEPEHDRICVPCRKVIG